MMIAETKPTPKPAMRRPMTITARPLAANICITTPARYFHRVEWNKVSNSIVTREGGKFETHDTATSDDSRTTTHHVGKVTSNKSTEEGTGGEDGDDERSVGRTDGGGISGDGADELFG